MDDKPEVLKLHTDLEACHVSIDETELVEIERTLSNIHRNCRTGYKVMDDIYKKLVYK